MKDALFEMQEICHTNSKMDALTGVGAWVGEMNDLIADMEKQIKSCKPVGANSAASIAPSRT